MADIGHARKALTIRILDGDGKAPTAERNAAFNNRGLAEPLATLVDKVARHASAVTDDDFAAAKNSGRNEDQLFEIVVCAAVGAASKQYDKALAALDAATQTATVQE